MVADIYQEILTKLDRQEKEEGKLPLLFQFYRRLLGVQAETKKRLGIPRPLLTKKDRDERIRNGLPLVRFEDLDIDWSRLRETFTEVIAVFRAYPGLFVDTPETEASSLTKELAKAWYDGTAPPESPSAGGESLLWTMLQATLTPLLRGYSEALSDSFNEELWRRRYCPICGGSPDFAFLDKEHGARRLSCSRCDTNWLYQRLECPCCGNQDQKSLAYFTDDEALYRLYVCERCKHYIKAMDLRQDKAELLLPLERLNTIDLDIQAKNQGYLPCGSPTRQ